MKKLSIKIMIPLFLFVIIFSFSALTYAQEITIKAGTPVPIRLLDDLSSESSTAGQLVRFEVTRDIVVDGIVVIKAGSEAVGEVSFAQKTGSLGKEGTVHAVVRHATSVDGTRVPLRASLSSTGNEQVALSYLICPLIKGTSSRVPAGTESKAHVDYDTRVTIQ